MDESDLFVLDERDIACPYCGERISVLIDNQELGEQYIEDCQVCCRPIVFNIQASPSGELLVAVYTEDDAF